MEDKIDWAEVSDLIKWYFEDKHDFDIDITVSDDIIFNGFIHLKTQKKYTLIQLYYYYLAHKNDE